MSMRQAWKINGYHFAKTSTERGGTSHFIDGTPYRLYIWQERMIRERNIEAAKDPSLGGRIKLDPAA